MPERKKYIFTLIIAFTVLLIMCESVLFFSYDKICIYNDKLLKNIFVKYKEDDMRQVVENVIDKIEIHRIQSTEESQKLAELVITNLQNSEEGNLFDACEKLMNGISSMEYGKALSVIIESINQPEAVLYSGGKTINLGSESREYRESLKECSIMEIRQIKDYNLYIFAEKDNIDEEVKEYIYNEIYKSSLDNQYIWVNEVLDYNGGDNYAVRLIHPNLKETEGTYLSTNTRDSMGNYPYLRELNGIKTKGYIFHTYFFKNKTNDKVLQKISYAEIYEPYDWIIATGEPLESVFAYTDKFDNTLQKENEKRLALSALIIFCSFGTLAGVVIFKWKRYLRKIDSYIEKELYFDFFTKAFNRKLAVGVLENEFETFKKTGDSPCIIKLSIDNFDTIHEKCGGEASEKILQKVVAKILKNIYSRDKLFRWFSADFFLVCYDMNDENEYLTAEKILSGISTLEFEHENEKFRLSASMAGTVFRQDDSDYKDVLERLNTELCRLKNAGGGICIEF